MLINTLHARKFREYLNKLIKIIKPYLDDIAQVHYQYCHNSYSWCTEDHTQHHIQGTLNHLYIQADRCCQSHKSQCLDNLNLCNILDWSTDDSYKHHIPLGNLNPFYTPFGMYCLIRNIENSDSQNQCNTLGLNTHYHHRLHSRDNQNQRCILRKSCLSKHQPG